MTIAAANNEIKELINKHHVYGAEVLINALVRACDGTDYLSRAEVLKLLDSAYIKLKEEKEHELSNRD